MYCISCIFLKPKSIIYIFSRPSLRGRSGLLSQSFSTTLLSWTEMLDTSRFPKFPNVVLENYADLNRSETFEYFTCSSKFI